MTPEIHNCQFIPVYLPPVQLFAAMAICQNLNWMVDGLYIKQTIRNRCTILEANGPLDLVVPVQKSNSKQLYKDVKISYQYNWQRQHLRAIASAYGSSPFYYYYKDKFENILLQNYNYLIDLNLAMIDSLFNIYKLKPIQNIDAKHPNPEDNLDAKHPSPEDNLDAKHPSPPSGDIGGQINPALQKQEERKQLIELSNAQQNYSQVFSEKFGFVRGLSMIDMLFNTSEKPYNKKP